MDYYSILGIPRNASAEDIRKAYKKKSMQHHPDRGGNEEEFKRVNEAYSTLKDPQKKSAYDNPQPQYRFDTSGMGGGFEDMFSQMFGQGFRHPHQHSRKNSDIRIRVSIDFDEIFKGKRVIASYRLRNGQEKHVDLDIPSGADDGDTIKFQGLGDNSIPNVRPGDLFVIIHVNNKSQWRRDKDNLHGKIDVNCLEMIVGTKIQIQTPDDRQIELTIKPGTKNNTTFSLKGYGVPNLHSKIKGNMYLTINAVIPQSLTTDQLSKIQEVLNVTIN